MGNPTKKKISFCITCMNRLYHLKDTLKKNIEDNYLPKEVEFVLLDYNSSDHLEKWVKDEMSDHINSGILVYYRTTTPIYYHRSHSRNIAFRLSEGNILCNLDADNYLGEGFAVEMISEFSQNPEIFYTSDLSSNDIFGRVLMLRENFYAVRGYNEFLEGYGFEDVDLYTRLSKKGLKQMVFFNPQYYNVIKHSKMDRISNERFVKNLNTIYISYINPYTSEILFLYEDHKFEHGCFMDIRIQKFYKESSSYSLLDNFSIENRDTLLKKQLVSGRWEENRDKIQFTIDNKIFSFTKNSPSFEADNQTYYRVTDPEFTIDLLLLLSTLKNIYESNEILKKNVNVNIEGFGRGIVYKNFDYKNKIILD
jgi:predicted glycosyltransferase involved in capsule biosynthesis